MCIQYTHTLYIYKYTNTYIYIYIYIYTRYPPKTDVFESWQRFWDKLPCYLSSSGGYHIYIYTHMCINYYLSVEPM